MPRFLKIAAAQMGPVQRNDAREDVVHRLVAMLTEAAGMGADLVAFPELALTTFFPRWHMPLEEADEFYESEMPNPSTQPLWDEAKRLGVGFALGYARLGSDGRRHNVYHLVDKEGETVNVFEKVHIPGHEKHEPWRSSGHGSVQ